ncbi:barstar family protein [Streptomyces sp. NPDC001093]|uniref:barstar family protein n=1 Tax=Streptomyces sp. NPDC001093 TaxID=3154376 RepID=UPI0033243369
MGWVAGIRVVSADATLPVARALPPTGLIHSARMQGREMRDSDGVFTQFYEALRLPDYFGWNWDALRDCLRDLHWLKPARLLVTIDDADAVLSETPEERGILWRALDDAVTFWTGGAALPGHEKITFAVVLLCSPGAQDVVREELRRELLRR